MVTAQMQSPIRRSILSRGALDYDGNEERGARTSDAATTPTKRGDPGQKRNSLPASPARINLAEVAAGHGTPSSSKPHRALPCPPAQLRHSLEVRETGGSPRTLPVAPKASPRTLPPSAEPIQPTTAEIATIKLRETPTASQAAPRTLRRDDPPSPSPVSPRARLDYREGTPSPRLRPLRSEHSRSVFEEQSPSRKSVQETVSDQKSEDDEEIQSEVMRHSLRSNTTFCMSSPRSNGTRMQPEQYSPTKFAEQIRIRGMKSKGNLHEASDRAGTSPVQGALAENTSRTSFEDFGRTSIDGNKHDFEARQTRSPAQPVPRTPRTPRTPGRADEAGSHAAEAGTGGFPKLELFTTTTHESPDPEFKGLVTERRPSATLASALRERVVAMQDAIDPLVAREQEEAKSRIFSYSSILDSYDDDSVIGHHTKMVFATLARNGKEEHSSGLEEGEQGHRKLVQRQSWASDLSREADQDREKRSPKYLGGDVDDQLLDSRRPSASSSVPYSNARHSYGQSSLSSHTTIPTSHSAASDTDSLICGTASSLRKSIDLGRKRSMRERDEYREDEYANEEHGFGLVRDDTVLFHQGDEESSALSGEGEYAKSPTFEVGFANGGEDLSLRLQTEIDNLIRDSRVPSAASNYSPRHQADYSGVALGRDHRDITPTPHRDFSEGTIRYASSVRPSTGGRKVSTTQSPLKYEQRPADFRRADDKRKVVVVGDGGAGKTALLIRYAKGTFPESYVPTVFENYVTQIAHEKSVIELALWDTAGQEDYDRLRPLSYPDSHVVLICFSVDSEASFNNVVEKWAPEIIHFLPTVPTVLVALKTDRRGVSGVRCISRDRGHRMAKDIGAAVYMECSARDGLGVQNVFEAALNVTLSDSTNGQQQGSVSGKRKAKKAKTCRIL